MAKPALQAPPQAGFDFTGNIRRVCADMAARLQELAHVDLQRVAISFSQARSPESHGLQATLTPMRFEHGALIGVRHGRRYRAERLYDAAGRELLYILSFYLPRFLNHPLEEKIATILHELWHISPAFNGDLRRYRGRCYAHGPSQQKYDQEVDQLAQRWWAARPPAPLYAFLRMNFTELKRRHRRVYGIKVPHPKLIPLGDE